MALGYRSFLYVDPDQPVVDTLIAHLDRWLSNKGIGTPAGKPGHYVRGKNDVITVVDDEETDCRTYRWRREHPYAQGDGDMWRTTVTAVERPHAAGFWWTEVELPLTPPPDGAMSSTFMSAPGFVREILGELSCRDGQTPVLATPQWVSEEYLPDLMDHLADGTRRGPVLVASHHGREPDELERWSVRVSWQLAGLGTMFLLDKEIEKEFNEMVGRSHAVAPGTVRTYAPQVCLDDSHDPKRHRTLGNQRIRYNPASRVCYLLGMAQRDRTSRIPVPEEARDVDLELVNKEKEMRPDGNHAEVVPLPSVQRNGTSAKTLSSATPNGRHSPAPPAQQTQQRTQPPSQLEGHASNGDSPQPVARAGGHHGTEFQDARSPAELQHENAALREHIQVLSEMLGNYQRCERAILSAVSTLNDEMKTLRNRLREQRANGSAETPGDPETTNTP
ncbi:hypothetical protein [Phytoactinopolyspora halophila]|nr:hypothetical protein [Phytoactinopolyspora halophila]